MSFLDDVENDIQNVFFNEDEFSINVNYYKHNIVYDSSSGNLPVPIKVVFYPDSIINNYGELISSEIGDYTLYIKESNYTTVDGIEINNIIDCEIGDYIQLINGKVYTIVTIREETMGSWTCGAMRRNVSTKTSSYKSYRS
jgi:hypothetical protein